MAFDVSAGTHLLASRAMIEEALALVDSGSAAVLGCGRCTEIPVRSLSGKLDRVDLVDFDAEALRLVEVQCQGWTGGQSACCFHCADLTGLIAKLEEEAAELVAKATEPLECLEQLGRSLRSAKPTFWTPPGAARCDLIVCSNVVTQLQATVREVVQRVFLARFPESGVALTTHEPWRQSLWSFARNLESAFLGHIGAMVRPGGIIFLSATVHVSWITQVDERSVATDGSWIATQTARLADYLKPSDTILVERSWSWLRAGREGRYWGRLYGVQAIIYRVRR
ncbi:MAG: hypothetical protein WCE49_03005 [Terrimicrobiaceae bacterium]